MEYKVLVCDDLKDRVDILVKLIDKCLNKLHVKFICDTSDSGLDAINKYIKGKYDIVFIDIDMFDCNIIKTTEKIFQINPNAAVIYVTNYPQFAEKAYEQFVFQYIIKPINESRLEIILKRAMEKVQKDKFYDYAGSFFILQKNNKESKIMNKDVIYFEKINNYTKIYMESRKVLKFRITYKILENIIDKNIYMRCHNGFIINKMKIKSISTNEIQLFNADKDIPIGRNYKDVVEKLVSTDLNA